MLEYEWGNPSSILLSGEEPTQDSDQTRQIFDQYNQNLSGNLFSQANNNYHQSFHEQQQQQQHQQQQTCSSPLHLYDPRIYATTTTTTNNNHNLSYPPPTIFLPESMAAVASSNFMMMHKNEDICGQRAPTTTAAASIDYSARIGLNLGGRTYFSSEDDFVNRFYRRSRQLEPGPANIPKCQAEGCNADLTHAKHYHRRHKVCEFHSKAATVLTAGMITQRFCQQCSRFHLLTEFDQGKRSCRKRLADHNRRRRKSNPPQPPSQQQQQQSQLPNTTTTHNSSTDHQNTTRSSPDSGGMHSSSSSVTVAMSHMECHALKRRT